ncbi:UPF0280 family protein [Methanobacterium aggregans]|uniref:UPF0280 family protein n=1 Tax=Methanobacterium aggregans TaxID=1615586 RepID=UPI001AEA10C5|nr:UPF0280 family protein [Methanobacterium aggregans]MBP2045692.1 ApbE superfamily uncharacterized protein (UPF0280 family) [Methanobacterium aggregans]
MNSRNIKIKRIQIHETNLLVKTDLEVRELYSFVFKQREELKGYIRKDPDFLTSLEPVIIESHEDAPQIVKLMARAGRKAEVGPMAAVAGTISQLSMGFLLNKGSKYVIVDNGGDISIKTNRDTVVGLYAGDSSLSGELGFKIKHEKTPMGICTSSGTVGHSISFGRADSVTVFAGESSTADALATSIANNAKGVTDEDAVQKCLERADDFKGIMQGVLVIVGESAGTIGKIPNLVETDKKVVLGDLWDTVH